MSRPMVSIVVNNFNYGHFLRECIDSALSQTYACTEVIAVDDGSTDDSKEIIASYGDLIVPILKENGGQASAFNAGFAASRGEIVIFLDADDLLVPEAAERVVEAWRPGLAKAQYRLEVIDATGRRRETTIPSEPMPGGDLRETVLSTTVHVGPPTSGNAFARHVLDRLLPMPEKQWKISADGYLLCLSPFFGDIMSLDEMLGFYRIHPSNHYTMGELDLSKLRRILTHDAQKQELLREFAGRRGLNVGIEPVLRVPGHVKARIASLRLDPDRHPFPHDRPHVLARKGIVACARDPVYPWCKKMLLSMWFVLVALLPRPVVSPLITFGLMPQGRPRLLAPLFR